MKRWMGLLLFLLAACATEESKKAPEPENLPPPLFYEEPNAQAAHVHFSSKSAALTDTDVKKVVDWVKAQKDWQKATVTVEGHTDALGADDYNTKLSKQRAEVVKQALVKSGVPEKNVVTKWYGKTKLLKAGKSKQAHQENRRADVTLTWPLSN